MNQNDCSGSLIKPWPVLLDHYILNRAFISLRLALVKLSATLCVIAYLPQLEQDTSNPLLWSISNALDARLQIKHSLVTISIDLSFGSKDLT